MMTENEVRPALQSLINYLCGDIQTTNYPLQRVLPAAGLETAIIPGLTQTVRNFSLKKCNQVSMPKLTVCMQSCPHQNETSPIKKSAPISGCTSIFSLPSASALATELQITQVWVNNFLISSISSRKLWRKIDSR
jgi:hypothetical protein